VKLLQKDKNNNAKLIFNKNSLVYTLPMENYPRFYFFHIHAIFSTILAGLTLIFFPKTKWKGRTLG